MKREISKTKIENRLRQKTNPLLVNTIIQLKKTNPQIAKILAMPRKKQPSINLSDMDKIVKDGETVFVPGKVLSSGELTKKIKIISWNASKHAIEKIKSGKSEFSYLKDEIKTNKNFKGVRILG